MRNFGRVLRLSLRYRFTVAAAILCALAIAVMWGGNIGTVYPFVEVVFRGRSMREWVRDEIVRAEETAADLAGQVETLRQRQADAKPPQAEEIAREIGYIESRRQAELTALAGRKRLKPYIDRFMPAEPFATLLLVVAALLVGTLIKDVFLILSTNLTERLCHLGTLNLRKQFYRRTLRMDLSSFSEQGSSELMSRFTYDIEQVTHGLRTLFGRAIREPLKMVACFAGAAWICWRLLILSLLVAPLAGFLINRLSRSIKRANRRAMEDMSQIYNLLSETFSSIKAVKGFTRERFERRRFHLASKQFYFKAMRIALYDSLIRPVTELTGICTVCLAILSGAYLVLSQDTHLLGIKMSDRPLSISALLLFYGLLAGVSDPARKLSDVFTRLQRSAAAADRIYQMLDREPKILDPVKPEIMGPHSREITFEGVDFSYGVDGEQVLRDIDLTIPFGQTLAIVGPNGCGKSTLANLVPRFFDPTDGVVRVDGIDLRDLRLQNLRGQIGAVTQETQLFNDTVAANIGYGKSDATQDEVIAAAQQAHADRFIMDKLDNGYQTIVGEGGSRLSGGQRQRIALARAILRDPRILILDEATSQVDLESEQLIHRVLAKFVQNRTTIIITHRMSTLDLADRIVVMDQGRVIDAGPHEQLLGRCDLYRRLYQLDFRASA